MSWDWNIKDFKEIIIVAIGAVMAFLFSMLVNKRAKGSAVKSLQNKLMQELEEHKKALESKLTETESIIKFYSPIWNLLLSSSLLDFDKCNYEKTVKIYVAIKKLEEYEISIKESNEESKRNIIKERENLIKTIEENKIIRKENILLRQLKKIKMR